MANDLLQLATSMEKKSKSIEKAASELAADMAKAIVGDLAFKTPVDTSRALSNWTTTLASPASGVVSPHFPGVDGSTQKASAGETISQANNVLASKKPGQAIYITNNLDYIRRLNDGFSRQAPAGFVERAVLIGRKMRKNFTLKD